MSFSWSALCHGFLHVLCVLGDDFSVSKSSKYSKIVLPSLPKLKEMMMILMEKMCIRQALFVHELWCC